MCFDEPSLDPTMRLAPCSPGGSGGRRSARPRASRGSRPGSAWAACAHPASGARRRTGDARPWSTWGRSSTASRGHWPCAWAPPTTSSASAPYRTIPLMRTPSPARTPSPTAPHPPPPSSATHALPRTPRHPRPARAARSSSPASTAASSSLSRPSWAPSSPPCLGPGELSGWMGRGRGMASVLLAALGRKASRVCTCHTRQSNSPSAALPALPDGSCLSTCPWPSPRLARSSSRPSCRSRPRSPWAPARAPSLP